MRRGKELATAHAYPHPDTRLLENPSSSGNMDRHSSIHRGAEDSGKADERLTVP